MRDDPRHPLLAPLVGCGESIIPPSLRSPDGIRRRPTCRVARDGVAGRLPSPHGSATVRRELGPPCGYDQEMLVAAYGP